MQYIEDYNNYYYKKYELCVIENWDKCIHGSSGDKKLDLFLKTKKVNYTSLDDEYDSNSRGNLIDFIDHWKYMLNTFFPVYPTIPHLALANTYVFCNYALCIDKTDVIVVLQRKWKKYYKSLKQRIAIAKCPYSLISREVYGRFPKVKQNYLIHIKDY